MTTTNLAKATPNGFLDFLIQSIVLMANDSTNDKFFLPKFLAGLKIDGDKPLVPYQTNMDMGQVADIQKQVSETLCNSGWAPFNDYDGGFASTIPTLNITSVTINGLNNASISDYQIYPPNDQLQYAIVFNAKMNAYSNYNQLTFNPAKFYFDVTCESCDKAHSEDVNATGNFTASIGQATFCLVLLVTLNDDLTTSIAIPESFAIPQGATISGLSILFDSNNGLKISDITLDGTNPMNQFNEIAINQAFGDQSTVSKIQVMFNSKINDSSIRSSCSEAIQDQFNSLINDLK